MSHHPLAELTEGLPGSAWYAWGDPATAPRLPAHAWRFLARETGLRRPARPEPPVPAEEARLAPTRLDDAARAALVAVVGADHVLADRTTRLEHTGGQSYPDVHRRRHGDVPDAPDAVVLPADAAQVQRLLAVCRDHRLTVVPYGGGTSVVGGVGGGLHPERSSDDARPRIVLDLRRLDQLIACDPVSRTATFQPGLRGPQIEAALRPYGMTLGHYPQSHQRATLGGYVATRSAGQASTGYGRIDEKVLGVRLATPEGELVLGGRAPASAAGPRLLDLVVGSEGTLGVITEATLAVHPIPVATSHAAYAFPSFEAATTALRELVQGLGHGLLPQVCRLSDATETRVTLALAGRRGVTVSRYARLRGATEPVLLVLVWEGAGRAEVRLRHALCARTLRRAAAVRLPAAVARGWERGRFSAPLWRDELIANGVLVETVETATTWSNLLPLKASVAATLREALGGVVGATPLVQCHVSHVYPTGASLYFTVMTPAGDDPAARWARAKAAATQAILADGGTVTHHHAVGTDHRDALAGEIGPLGVRVLQTVRRELDPGGVLNPGVLTAADPGEGPDQPRSSASNHSLVAAPPA